MASEPLSHSRRQQLIETAVKDGFPREMLVDMPDDDLRAIALDFSDDEIEERMRDTDEDEYVACLISPTDRAQALIEFLANLPMVELESLARDPVRVRELLARDYLGLQRSTDLPPDTLEAAEAATRDDQQLRWARLSWDGLTPGSRGTYLEIFERVAGEMGIRVLLRLLGQGRL